ncbi:MAG: ATP-binding protein [Oscillospiraceae bacterium]|nr:ATP-binding protein [Oscillospiraceae bacterium]
MEQTELKNTLAEETAALKEENRKLKSELRTMTRELNQRKRSISVMESNFNVKMNMFRSLAAENEKRRSFLKHMMKNSEDFLILLDNQRNIAYCSDMFLRKINVEYFSEVEGKNIFRVYETFAKGDFLETIKFGFIEAVERNSTCRQDVVADICDNGEYRAYRITNTPMIDDGLSGFIINWTDTTDIMTARNEAEKANKGKSNFLAIMSHEIRTPLNAIIGIAQIGLQRGDLPKRHAEALDRIYSSGNSLLGIVNDILDLSKIETGKLELNPSEYDIPSLINDAVQVNIVRIGVKDINFMVEADKNLPAKLYGDELRLKQILNNLLSNAIKYTDSGFVKLSVTHTVFEPEVHSGYKRDIIDFDDDNENDVVLRFSVSDSGYGLKQEDKEKLFSDYLRFVSMANRSTEGVGLGLSITKNLVEMMDGKIEVKSEYGEGSTFTVEVTQKSVPCPAIGSETSEQLKNFTFGLGISNLRKNPEITRNIMPYGRVLVVDDAETNLYVARGLLAPYKLTVRTAVSGFSAIDLIKSGRKYDIIFMDHMMPQMDGIETTKKLRSLGYRGTIIALTANALAGNAELFAKNGFDDFVPKPIDTQHLNTVLDKYIKDKYPEEAKKYADQTQTDPQNNILQISPKLLEVFRVDAQNAVTTLRQSIKNNDLKIFTTTVHAMKSALANIGEEELSEVALGLEKAGLSDDRSFISKNAENFIEMLESFADALTQTDSETDDNDGGEELFGSAEYLNEQLKIIAAACGDYDDSTAYTALNLLKEKHWKKKIADGLEEIRNMLFLHSDFEEAEKRAKEIMDS